MIDWLEKEILVFGCGNILFGDDGIGVEIAKKLKEENFPENVGIIEAGTSIRGILFDISLSEKKPKKIIIIDGIDAGRAPGEVFYLDIDEIPHKKIDDFSMHQLPTSNLLKELKDFCNVNVKIIGIQVEKIPEEVSPGVSPLLTSKIPRVLEIVKKEIKEL